MRRDLLPGFAAGKLAIWAVGVAAFFIVYTAIFFAGMAIAGVGYGASPGLTALFVIWCVGGAVTAILNLFLHYWVVPRELRAGYTTAYRIHQEVEYVDPQTRYVLRVAGEPFLEPAERRRREALVNQVLAIEDPADDGAGG
jgi:hypothetical protein